MAHPLTGVERLRVMAALGDTVVFEADDLRELVRSCEKASRSEARALEVLERVRVINADLELQIERGEAELARLAWAWLLVLFVLYAAFLPLGWL